jgi:ADP-ribosylation factor-like protein 13B
MGVIYVIDASDPYNLERSKQIFGAIMSNDLLMGKPMLVFANKQDKSGAIDSLDICDFFEVEYLANLFRTPCYVEGVGRYDPAFDMQAARTALGWLLKTISINYKTLQNKIRFLRVVTQNESLASNEEIPRKYRRPLTGKRKVSVTDICFSIFSFCLFLNFIFGQSIKSHARK